MLTEVNAPVQNPAVRVRAILIGQCKMAIRAAVNCTISAFHQPGHRKGVYIYTCMYIVYTDRASSA
jgi:hypothetical protein